jgi:hypothetical protein
VEPQEVVNWMVTKYGGYFRALQKQGYFRELGHHVGYFRGTGRVTFFDMNFDGNDLEVEYLDENSAEEVLDVIEELLIDGAMQERNMNREDLMSYGRTLETDDSLDDLIRQGSGGRVALVFGNPPLTEAQIRRRDALRDELRVKRELKEAKRILGLN